jgi:hypothetical protein
MDTFHVLAMEAMFLRMEEARLGLAEKELIQ